MADRISDLQANIEQLKSSDISFENLGAASNFKEAEELKNSFCEYIGNLLEMARKVSVFVNASIIESALSQVESNTNSIRSVADNMQKLVDEGVHNEKFPNQRQSLIASIQQTNTQVRKQLALFETSLKIGNFESLFGSDKKLDQIRDETASMFEAFKKDAAEAKKILNNLQDKVMAKGLSEATKTFAELSGKHAKFERRWFITFVIASTITIILVVMLVTLHSDLSAGSTSELLSSIFVRILVITTPLLFMRVAISKYNLERNLRILYDHRETVLAQYWNFESAIGEDTQAKNQIRLEIAKYVFSDPATGYITMNKSSEIAVNPVVNVVERILKST